MARSRFGRTAKQGIELVRWAATHPGDVRAMARGLLPARAAAPLLDGDHEPPAEVASFDRSVAASAQTSADVAAARAVMGDLGLLPQWMAMHAGFRGDAPGVATEGATFVEQVKIMGIPAEIAWTVEALTDRSVVLRGRGPMGLGIGLWFELQRVADGTRIWVDAGVSGDPIKGPMGGAVANSVADALQTSLTTLARLLDEGLEGSGAGAAGSPVLHAASGVMLDPATPVIVGVGQVTQRVPDPTKEPADLAAEALRAAESDSGATGLLAGADAVYAVASASWPYRDLGAAVASRVGASPATTLQSARFGGDGGQALVNEAGRAIGAGEATVVLVTGAEAGATLAAAQKDGITPAWSTQPDDVAPDRTVGSEREANNQAEAEAGLGAPVYTYALIESALRAKLGESVDEHQQTITRLWSQLSAIAADNPHAWQPQALTPEDLLPGEGNRPVSSPYPKLLCANLQVDLATGLIVTSVAAAEAAGVPQDRWVFLHAGAAANDEWFVSERGDLAASPAIRTLGRTVLEHAGLGIDDVDLVDLYSCFPAAVQIAAAELGLPVGDPDRPLSVTGGLTFAGGPGNNYGGHAVATMVQRLREKPGAVGLTTSLGWYLTKHAVGLYSTTPPARPFASLAPVLDPAPTRPVLTGHTGPATIEAATVQFDRSGDPEAAIVSAVTPEGARVLVRTTDRVVVDEVVAKDPIGWSVEIAGDTLTVANRRRRAVPAVPEPTVLVERRGAVRVITLNRPARKNAIDLPTAQLLERVIDAFEADPTARVAVLTGADGTFCAGMDLKAAAAGQFALTDKRGPLGIARVPITKPVIAAVEGHALAGGCELALVADLIVASTASQFGIPEPKRGLVAAAGGVLRLTQRLPRNVAMELALTGDPMPATRLAELGLVNRLAEPGTALDVAVALAEQIVTNAPLSIEASRRIVLESADWTREEEFDKQSDLAGLAIFSDDATEGVLAFAEHRAPVWSGR